MAATFANGTNKDEGVAVLVFWLSLTSYVASMVVNALVTGLIVFKILKVFLEVKAASVEQTLGTTEGTKLRHVIFIIIESGMALLAIQVVRVVINFLPLPNNTNIPDFVVVTHQMFNVIMRSVQLPLLLFY
jgi:hypothetical protein